jgi:hypothetical protein
MKQGKYGEVAAMGEPKEAEVVEGAIESTPKGPANLAPLMVDDGVDPWDDTVEGTVTSMLPIVKIAYENSKNKPDGAAIGELFNAATGEVMDEIKFIWLSTRANNFYRKKYDPTAQAQEPIICKSANGMTPTGGAAPLTGPCRRKVGNVIVDTCPLLKWQDDPERPGKRKPPACFAACPMLCFDCATASPFIFTPARTGMKHFRALKTRMRALKGQMTDRAHPGIPGFLRTPILLRTRKAGIYFEPSFDILISPEDRAPVEWGEALMSQMEAWKAQLARMDPDDITDADVESPSGDPDSFQVEPDGSMM